MTKGNPAWEKFERYVQNMLDLRSTAGSGNQWHDVGDGVSIPEDPYKLIVDCKFTEKKTYSVNGEYLYAWWEKAATLGYHFSLPIRLEGSPTLHREWAVVNLDDYAELIDAIRILNAPKHRCGAWPYQSGNRDLKDAATLSCCRKSNHSGNHDNGEIEWEA